MKYLGLFLIPLLFMSCVVPKNNYEKILAENEQLERKITEINIENEQLKIENETIKNENKELKDKLNQFYNVIGGFISPN